MSEVSYTRVIPKLSWETWHRPLTPRSGISCGLFLSLSVSFSLSCVCLSLFFSVSLSVSSSLSLSFSLSSVSVCLSVFLSVSPSLSLSVFSSLSLSLYLFLCLSVCVCVFCWVFGGRAFWFGGRFPVLGDFSRLSSWRVSSLIYRLSLGLTLVWWPSLAVFCPLSSFSLFFSTFWEISSPLPSGPSILLHF